MKFRYLLPIAACLLVIGLSLTPSGRKIDGGRFGKIHISSVVGSPTGVTFLFSSADGWSERDRNVARELAKHGVLTIGIDSRSYLSRIAGEKADCQYLPGDVEFISEQLQRAFSTDIYHTPVVAGFGAGARIAEVIRDQAPANTVLGAIVSKSDSEPQLPVSLCNASTSGRVRRPEFLDTLLPEDAGGLAAAVLMRTPSRLKGAAKSPLATLPLIELPASAKGGGRLAVVMSGDGGWRDLDKEISEHLRRDGVSVVGWDSLRYFWSEKTTDQISKALGEVLDHYTKVWRAPKVTLIGYSFGASVLPFAYNRLPDRIKAHIDQIVLMAPGATADFQIRVSGLLGVAPRASAASVREQVAMMPTKDVQCFYGADDTQSVCPALLQTHAEVIRTAGGHHFDGNYHAIEGRILSFRRPMPEERLWSGPTYLRTQGLS
ncbi:AcvB/VirJ family lysyl-phosphatidylglycerol hydrolase [Pandoraea sp. CB10b_02]|uniref:virulence factor family protein n=1 Tax=Pandoraea sp. CB10b_02 TaxID=2014535 RepID=UPI00257B4EB0|nr:AcvB/VirJ family lysyl-phosphatidylglycerol hydrolase [Pandoraea sp. CB10b_02]